MSFNKSKKKKSSSKSKRNIARIGQYLVAKNKKTKYLKLGTSKDAPKEVRMLIKKLIAALGTDVIFVNLFDEAFRKKYKIKDFVKGSISVDMDAKLESEDEDEADDDSEDEDTDESDDESEDDEDSDDDEDESDEDDDDLPF